MKLEFSRQGIEKKTFISNLIKTRPVWVELFHADKRTDGHEANSRISQFCERA